MVEKTATINNPLGIHARPAALLVQTAAQFKADIYLSKGDVDGGQRQEHHGRDDAGR